MPSSLRYVPSHGDEQLLISPPRTVTMASQACGGVIAAPAKMCQRRRTDTVVLNEIPAATTIFPRFTSPPYQVMVTDRLLQMGGCVTSVGAHRSCALVFTMASFPFHRMK